ncbi:hypothetical protein [Mesocricetibacter intestinalis]|uniref:hypothetical protein n=1 Tax=Mesocricetibacter intestinalis TaxID=1521930 RepID=UPI0010609EF4|nr:hypothetical protein [Mesocricetibacter intestinalis]
MEYKTYKNITVDIKNNEIHGNLNKYVAIKHINKQCYKLNCGFPESGQYDIKEIKFITIEKKVFLYYACTSKETCFYNIDDEFISKFKEYLYYDEKDKLKFAIINIIGMILASFLDSIPRKIRRKRGLLDE